ncbi:MAG: glycoside hydrolase family 15 protein [Chloroflexi bacterium]|nr:glycoside hydrolase family 15 protein [Chloroflexota bacterium]MYD48485.1 glycoside hydrolase family 15 protein [Chloroflexota bacterium]
MAYLPIEDYGIVGNMRTCALIGVNGSVDWFCCPRFDSPSVFGAILDEQKGGHFKIAPVLDEPPVQKQVYWPASNVLITRFLGQSGVAEIIDFMPVSTADHPHHHTELIRRVSCVRGVVPFVLECYPAFNYARDSHRTELNEYGAAFVSDELGLQLSTNVLLEQDGNGVLGVFALAEGESVTISIGVMGDTSSDYHPLDEAEGEELFEETVTYWRDWLSQCTYKGRWQEMVERSALVLKLLTYEPTGAIIAAPTCSLPEELGGERNWDYRYTWIRDAAFTLYALLRIGFTNEASRFMHWLESQIDPFDGDFRNIQILYGIDGRRHLEEITLDHLEGYRGSRPVRIGNGAYDQLQLDIYGELMDSVYLFNRYGEPISFDFWTKLRQMTNWVCDNWRVADEGIWETRGGRQHFVYSKLMCWVALDRAVKLADSRSFPSERLRWLEARDEIYEEIQSQGWSEDRQAFVQHYGSDSLDASNLIMPLVFFMSPTDPRMLSTLDAINRSPRQGGLVSDSLVYRYNSDHFSDGLAGQEGTFNMCTFWLVESLTRAGWGDPKRLDQARLMFEKMLGYANHLGLYAEETGPSGEGLGNFPQAFTHLALISSAFNLDRALSGIR